MNGRFDPISLVEECYAPASGTDIWADRMLGPIARALSLDRDAPMIAYSLGESGEPEHALAGRAGSHWEDLAEQMADVRSAFAGMSPTARRSVTRAVQSFGLTSCIQTTGAGPDSEVCRAQGFVDAPVVIFHQADGSPVIISGLTRQRFTMDSSQQALWRKLSAHLSAGWRLAHQRTVGQPEEPEGVLTPDGRVVDARGRGRPRSARAELRDAVRSLEQARSRRGRMNAAAALDLWQGLFSGRWSLVDHFDSDGKRFLLARANELRIAAPNALSRRQRQALFYAAAGWSNKEIAYALGVSTTTVATHLRRGLEALGMGSRARWVSTAAEITGAVRRCTYARSEAS